jgi:hypothetical protein
VAGTGGGATGFDAIQKTLTVSTIYGSSSSTLTGKIYHLVYMSPTGLDFGALSEGQTSSPLTLTVGNNTGEDATVTLPSAASIAPFVIDPTSSCVTNPGLATQQTCQLIVRFVAPVGGPDGPVQKALTVSTIYGSSTSTLTGVISQ